MAMTSQSCANYVNYLPHLLCTQCLHRISQVLAEFSPLFLTDFNLLRVFPIFNMPSKSETSYDKRQLIIFHRVKKKSYTEIAKIVQLNRNTVASIVQRYEKENRFELKKNKWSSKVDYAL